MEKNQIIVSFKLTISGIMFTILISGIVLCEKSYKPNQQLPAKSEEIVEGCSQGEIELSNSDSLKISPELWNLISGKPALQIGEDSAKITIVEFTDYECPFCAKYVTQIRPQIIEKYVQTSKVKYIIRDSPLSYHKMAFWAHQAARCAGEQNAYGEMNEILFLNQKLWTADIQYFPVLADNLKINVTEFDKCVMAHNSIQAINADIGLADKVSAEIGGLSLPMVIIDGYVLYGVKRLESYTDLIGNALKNSEANPPL